MVEPTTPWRCRPSDPALAAWKNTVAQIRQRPWLFDWWRRRDHKLVQRFVAWYHNLRGLRRRCRRSLQQRIRFGLAGAALLLALSGMPVGARPQETIVVDGICTLADAITAANTDAAAGDCPAGNQADIIDLRVNVILSAINNNTDGPNGLPSITSAITIQGNGHTIQRDSSAPRFRIFHVGDAGSLILQNAIVSGGELLSGSTYAERSGGGIFNQGALTVR